LHTGQKKERHIIDFLIEEFENTGYSCNGQVLTSSDFRTPQKRKRFFLVGLKGKKRFSFPAPICGSESDLFTTGEPYRTVGEALSDLPPPQKNSKIEYSSSPKSKLQRFLRDGSDGVYNHIETKHSLEMIEKLRAQLPGTCLYPNWNHSWYKLLEDKPANTIKENHRATSVHYKDPRCISPRECARLQTLPDSLILLGTKTEQLIMVGNAVPSILSAHIASSIMRQAYNQDPIIDWSTNTSPI
jgi:DNA (cytosine-5)-methyltransferase 1